MCIYIYTHIYIIYIYKTKLIKYMHSLNTKNKGKISVKTILVEP